MDADPRRPDDLQQWLPDFCSAPTVLVVIVIAQLVGLVALLTPVPQAGDVLAGLGPMTIYVQWIALTGAAALCALRRSGLRFGAALTFVVAELIVLLIAMIIALLVVQFAVSSGLDWAARNNPMRFILSTLAITALVSAAGLRYGYVHRQWQLQLEANARARFEALQAKIRPHFLFNSINTIASLARSQPERAEHALEDLADLFRAVLGKEQRRIPLAEELELMRRYLELEALRLGPRLQIDWQVPEALPNLPVPPLLLQPLAENAVYHGIQPRAEGGTLAVRVTLDARLLAIEIVNPLPPTPVRPGHGLAQANVRDRIAYAYGGAGRLEVECDGERYRCRVVLPREV